MPRSSEDQIDQRASWQTRTISLASLIGSTITPWGKSALVEDIVFFIVSWAYSILEEAVQVSQDRIRSRASSSSGQSGYSGSHIFRIFSASLSASTRMRLEIFTQGSKHCFLGFVMGLIIYSQTRGGGLVSPPLYPETLVEGLFSLGPSP